MAQTSMQVLMTLLVVLLVCSPCRSSDTRMTITVEDGNHSVEAGEVIDISIRMLDLGDQTAAGFQAFLEFDPNRVSFVEGVYTTSPFGLPIITPIQSVDATIDLASGIDPFEGEEPSNITARLAILTFVVEEDMSCMSTVVFRNHVPETKLTDEEGMEITPLLLQGLPAEPPHPDINQDGHVNVDDLLLVLNNWGECEDTSNCPMDLDCNADVNVDDLLVVLNNWG